LPNSGSARECKASEALVERFSKPPAPGRLAAMAGIPQPRCAADAIGQTLSPGPPLTTAPTSSPPSSGRSRPGTTPRRFADIASFWRRRIGGQPAVNQVTESVPVDAPVLRAAQALEVSVLPDTEDNDEGLTPSSTPSTASSGPQGGFGEFAPYNKDIWSPAAPTRLSSRFSETPSPSSTNLTESGKQLKRSACRVHSPTRTTAMLTTPDSMDSRMLSTPKTTASWASRTSIATPETGGSGRSKSSPSPDTWHGDSELELALELVNHVPPHVADRLIKRLRSAEAARCSAEDRCRQAEERRAQAESVTQRSGLTSCRWLLWPLLAVLACWALERSVVGQSLSSPATGALPSMRAAQKEQAIPEIAVEEEVCGSELETSEQSQAAALACEALLWEAQEEAEELRRRNKDLQDGYAGALQAVSQWVGFLHNVWGLGGLAAHDNTNLKLSSGELEAHCLEAAKPGRTALEALIKPKLACEGNVAHRLAERLANLEKENERLLGAIQPVAAIPAVPAVGQ